MKWLQRLKSLQSLSCAILMLLSMASQAGSTGLSAESLFPNDAVLKVRISPGGRWMVATAYSGRTAGLLAQRLGTPEVKVIHNTQSPAKSVDWIGKNTVLAAFGSGRAQYFIRVDFSEDEEQALNFKVSRFSAPGYLVDPLPLLDDVLIWEIDLKDRNTVHRTKIDELVDPKYPILGRRGRGPVRLGETVASIDGTSHKWLTNDAGTPLVATRYDEDGYTILYRKAAKEKFKPIYQYKFDEMKRVFPLAWASDRKTLVVSGHNGKKTVGLFEFDPSTASIGKTIYHRDDVDIGSVRVDPVTRDVLSVQFDVGSVSKNHHLKSSQDRFAPKLGPDDHAIEKISVVSSSANRDRFVYWTEGPTEPGAHYFRNVDLDETNLVGLKGSKIDRSSLRSLESFFVESTDDFSIEALLTLPEGSPPAGHPLVVMPHGGPIGVHDQQRFDPVVQYLASWGFAVLQANYRGSAGYGAEFEEAGMGQWAKGIEDDIAAAISEAAARPTIDENRICILGGSYGGFSSLTSVLRNPDRFRCAGTLNGVTDVPLLFESSDVADSESTLDYFAKMLGDPETERDQLLSISPVYQIEKLNIPILVVYGEEDRRVDRDHAHRLISLLKLYGKEFQEVRVKGARHSFSRTEWISVLSQTRRFLTKHLMPMQIFKKDPIVE